MTTVFDQSSPMAGTDDGNGNQNFNMRLIIAPAGLSAASGAQCQLVFLWGTGEAIQAGAITTVYFGQSSGTAPNFTGDQVQVKFGGNPGFDGSAAGIVTSDTFTLAQAFDNTKSYTCAWHYLATDPGHASTSANANAVLWGGASADSASLTAPSPSLGNFGAQNFFLEKIIVTGASIPVSGGLATTGLMVLPCRRREPAVKRGPRVGWRRSRGLFVPDRHLIAA